MKRKRISNQKLSELCSEVHPDDGLDPADFFRPTRPQQGNQRKARQLCQQVAQTLSLVLSGEFGEELQDLRIVAVTPAPDASQLLVLLAPAGGLGEINADAVLARLAIVAGALRREVAASITRKRAPKLLFQLVPGPRGEEVAP